MKKMRIFMVMLVMLFAIAVSANAAVIFEDNFDSYGSLPANTTLGAASASWTVPWADSARDIKVGPTWPGKAYFSDSYWADSTMRFAQADLGASLSDYVVEVEAWMHGTYKMEWTAGGRISGSDYVGVTAVLGSADPVTGTIPVYAKVTDSTGAYAGDYYVGTFDSTMPINISLTLQGSDVVGLVEHNGFSATITATTTVTGAGDAGFGGFYKWGYPLGDFDNFAVSEVPEPATLALLGIGFGLISLRKKN